MYKGYEIFGIRLPPQARVRRQVELSMDYASRKGNRKKREERYGKRTHKESNDSTDCLRFDHPCKCIRSKSKRDQINKRIQQRQPASFFSVSTCLKSIKRQTPNTHPNTKGDAMKKK